MRKQAMLSLEALVTLLVNTDMAPGAAEGGTADTPFVLSPAEERKRFLVPNGAAVAAAVVESGGVTAIPAAAAASAAAGDEATTMEVARRLGDRFEAPQDVFPRSMGQRVVSSSSGGSWGS